MKLKLLTITLIFAAFYACNSGKKAEQQQSNSAETELQQATQSEIKTDGDTITNNEKMDTMNDQTKQTAEVKTSTEPVFDIVTSLGTIRIKLYNETPKHRDNFIKLVDEGYYDGVLFHRVINNFMIQTGDPNSKNASVGTPLGVGGPNYQIDAEILPQFKHKKGAVAAARQGDQVNPERKSSGSQFYIVHNSNGTPHLDGQYSVFGETLSGLDIVDKIATSATGQFDRPVQDIKIEKIVRVE